MSERPLTALILAAGEGTRMRSMRPKPLHLLCGRAMLLYVLDALAEVDVARVIVVIGHGAERVTKKLQEEADGHALDFVEQHVPRGTGDAVSVGLTAFGLDDLDEGDLIVLPGDAPLLRPGTIAELVAAHQSTEAACTVLTTRLGDPSGHGRIVRGRDDKVVRAVPEADASDEELASDEVNTLVYCFRRSVLAPSLRRLSPENSSGEYYLADVLEVLSDAGYLVASHECEDPTEALAVNDRIQLARGEAVLRERTNLGWLRAGVTMVDPERTYIDATVRLGTDVTIFPNTLLQGRTVVGDGVELGPDSRLVDCMVGDGAIVEKTVGRDAEIGPGARVGPFVVLEPGAQIAPHATSRPFSIEQESGADSGDGS